MSRWAEGYYMVFVNLKKSPPVQPKRAATSAPEKRCMNCGTVLDSPMGGIDARRFCSQECKSQYLDI